MKTKILISVFCVCSLFQVQAQVFPTSNAIWNIKIAGRENYYGLSGDTTINSFLYNKLYLLNDTTLNVDSEDVYVGAFRQEEKKVWFRPCPVFFELGYDGLPYSEETILYDFSKNVGDTIWHNLIEYDGWRSEKNYAASIIYDIEDSETGKIFYTSQCGNTGTDEFPHFYHIGADTWVEGVGSLWAGLFWFLYYPPMSGGLSPRLACFKQGDEILYMGNTQCNSCFCWSVGIPNINSIPLEIVQESDFIRIQSDLLAFPCDLELFSPTGQLVLKKEVQSDREEIPFNQKGAWIYRVQKEGAIVKTGKIIIK